MTSWLNLEGKTAVVTGGASGIGKTVVQSFLDNGANVVVCDMNPKEPEFEHGEGSGDVLYVVTDVTKADSVRAMVEKAKAKFGKLDILVNNAGITRHGLLIRMKDEDFDAVIDTNLKGVFYCTKAAAKIMMKKRSGRIVNMSSVVGLMGNAGQTNYAAAKAGVLGFSKSAAKELAARGVTVNMVAPGFIDTDMTAVLSDKVKDAMVQEIPMRKMGRPEDVANAVLFLVSDCSSYITGQVVNVDGGMVM